MAAERFDSPYLRWYLNYACRDDYGATAEATSAWAGIHYFASREPEDKGPLVWPEGNGWVVHRLLEKVGRFVRTKSMVYSIRGEGARYRVTTEEVEYIADAVIDRHLRRRLSGLRQADFGGVLSGRQPGGICAHVQRGRRLAGTTGRRAGRTHREPARHCRRVKRDRLAGAADIQLLERRQRPPGLIDEGHFTRI